ncbi:MAG: phosphopantetheine-binding protein [Thermodesulfobacteriota bacterium]
MNDLEIVEIINTALARELELDPARLTPEASLFDDLELDSLDLVDMVIVLEQAFNFKIREEEEVRSIRTLGDIHQFVIRKKHHLEGNS